MVRRRVAGRTRSAPKPPPVLKDDKEKRRLLPVAPVIPPAKKPVENNTRVTKPEPFKFPTSQEIKELEGKLSPEKLEDIRNFVSNPSSFQQPFEVLEQQGISSGATERATQLNRLLAYDDKVGSSYFKGSDYLKDFYDVKNLDLTPLERKVVETRDRLEQLTSYNGPRDAFLESKGISQSQWDAFRRSNSDFRNKGGEELALMYLGFNPSDEELKQQREQFRLDNKDEIQRLSSFMNTVAPSVTSSIYDKQKQRLAEDYQVIQGSGKFGNFDKVEDEGLEQITDMFYNPSGIRFGREELGLEPLKSRKDIDLERFNITEEDYNQLNLSREGLYGLAIDPVKSFLDNIERQTLKFDGKIGEEGYQQIQQELDTYKQEFIDSLGREDLSDYDQTLLDRAFNTDHRRGSKFKVDQGGSGFSFDLRELVTDNLFNIVGNQLGDDFVSNMLKADLQNVRQVFDNFQESGDIFAALGDTFNASMASPTSQFVVNFVPGAGPLVSTAMKTYTKVNEGEALTTADAFDIAVSAAQYGAFQEAQAVESQLLAEGFNTEVAAAEAAEASQRYMDKFYLGDLQKVDTLQQSISNGTPIPQALAQVYGGDVLDAAALEGYQEIAGQVAVDAAAGTSVEQSLVNVIKNTEQGKNLFYENLNRAGVPMSAINLLYEDDKGARVLTDYFAGEDIERSIASIYSEDIANSLLGEDGNARAATIAGLKATKNYTGVDFEDPTTVSDFLKQTYTDYTDAGGNLDFFNFLQGDGEDEEGNYSGFDFGSLFPEFNASFFGLTGQDVRDFFSNVSNPFEKLSGFNLGSLDIDPSLLEGDLSGLDLEGLDLSSSGGLDGLDGFNVPNINNPINLDELALNGSIPEVPIINVPELEGIEGVTINTPTAPELPSFGEAELSLDAALDGLNLPSLEGSLDLGLPSLDLGLGGLGNEGVTGGTPEEEEENKDPNEFQGLDYDANILGNALARIKSLKV